MISQSCPISQIPREETINTAPGEKKHSIVSVTLRLIEKNLFGLLASSENSPLNRHGQIYAISFPSQ